MSQTYRLSNNSYLSLSDNNLNYFEVIGSPISRTDLSTAEETFADWKENAIDIGDYKVIPFGKNNDVRQQIQESVFPNAFAFRTLKRKVELLLEQGPYIYTQVVDGRQYYRQPEENKQILEWLYSFEFEELLLKNATDFYYEEVVYNKIFRQRAGRLGAASQPKTIEHISSFKCLPAYRKNSKTKIPTHIMVGDWVKSDKKEMVVYPIFDKRNPDKYPVAIHVSKMPTYGLENLPLPEIYGSLYWINTTTQTPRIFKSFIEKSLNIKWHIQSPQSFWDAKRKIIQDNCKTTTPQTPYKEKMLEDLKSEILDKLSELLSGVDNVGKFWHNEYVVRLLGGNAVEEGWKIVPIEQKTKEWVESQVKMYETGVYAMQAGLGLPPSLALVGADGKPNSGSEQYYAYAIHQKTATPIPEMIVTKSINDLIAIKFDPKYRVGFFRTKPEHTQDVTNSERLVSTTQQNNGSTI